MKFFRRGPKEEQPQTGWMTQNASSHPAPAPAPEPRRDPVAEILGEDPLGGISTDPQSVAEAKLSIKELRLRKKHWQTMKREVAAEVAEENARWRERQAGRYSTVALGRGTMGRIVRASIQSGRRDERMVHAEVINALQERRQAIDEQIGDVDQAIVDMERYVLRHAAK